MKSDGWTWNRRQSLPCAAAWNIPFLIARSISDTFDEDLPLDFNRCRTSDGRVSRRKVIQSLIWRPRALKGIDRIATEVCNVRRKVGRVHQRIAAAYPVEQTCYTHKMQIKNQSLAVKRARTGLGLFALKRIPANRRIVEYTGTLS